LAFLDQVRNSRWGERQSLARNRDTSSGTLAMVIKHATTG
jgi:hypothetical protein